MQGGRDIYVEAFRNVHWSTGLLVEYATGQHWSDSKEEHKYVFSDLMSRGVMYFLN